MIQSKNLGNKILNLINARGLTDVNHALDYVVTVEWEKLPKLVKWDERKLGPAPTQAEIDGMSDTPPKQKTRAEALADDIDIERLKTRLGLNT